MKKNLLLLCLSIGLQTLWAQNLALENFQAVLAQAQLHYTAPLENTYKEIPVQKNEFHPYEYAVKSKNLEIRYSVKALQQKHADTNHIPHLKSFSIANSLADNKQDQAIAVHNISSKDLSEKYNADWGTIIYFRPKSQFSGKSHCKMLSLFAEGKADVYIFYLFDEPSKELDQQRYTIRFSEN